MNLLLKRIGVLSLLLSACLFSVTHANAQSTNPQECKAPTTRIYYINGVNNTDDQSLEGQLKIWQELSRDPAIQAIHAASPIEYLRIPNPSENVGLDFIEAAFQVLVDGASSGPPAAMAFMAYLDSKFSQLSDAAYRIARGEKPKISADRMAPAYVRLAAAYRDNMANRLSTAAVTAITQEHGPALVNDIKAGDHVLLIPHSQGNFYARELRNYVLARLSTSEEQNRIRVFNIAPPLKEIPNNQTLLSSSDLVAGILGTPNTHLPLTSDTPQVGEAIFQVLENQLRFGDPLGHNLVAVYLDNKTEMLPDRRTHRSLFVSSVVTLLNEMQEPSQCAITATITDGKCRILDHRGIPIEGSEDGRPQQFYGYTRHFHLSGTVTSKVFGPEETVPYLAVSHFRLLNCGEWSVGTGDDFCFRETQDQPETAQWFTMLDDDISQIDHSYGPNLPRNPRPIEVSAYMFPGQGGPRDGVMLATRSLVCNR